MKPRHNTESMRFQTKCHRHYWTWLWNWALSTNHVHTQMTKISTFRIVYLSSDMVTVIYYHVCYHILCFETSFSICVTIRIVYLPMREKKSTDLIERYEIFCSISKKSTRQPFIATHRNSVEFVTFESICDHLAIQSISFHGQAKLEKQIANWIWLSQTSICIEIWRIESVNSVPNEITVSNQLSICYCQTKCKSCKDIVRPVPSMHA